MIYLDNAATSYPKPRAVYDEVIRCMRVYCGNPGRSSHRMSLASAEKIYECRSLISRLVNLGAPECVAFTLNTSYALNIAIKAIARYGDHFITSDIEHNSVLRPLYELKKTKKITVSHLSAFLPAQQTVTQIKQLINPKTRAVVVSHASNILPIILPLHDIGRLCRKRNILFIADCAQSAGVYEIDMQRDLIDIVCIPSHKGLLGIQGAGAVCFSPRLKPEQLSTFAEGGGGVNSGLLQMPDFLPDRFEAGTMPTPAIAGLCEGLKFINERGIESIRVQEEAISSLITDRLTSLRGVEVYGQGRGSSVLFNIEGINCEDVAGALDASGICVRAGLHCAPLAHRQNGTDKTGGVRVSPGVFNTARDADKLYEAVKRITLTSL